MKTVRSIVGRHPDQDTASPHWIAPRDPYSGDEALIWPGSHKDYLAHAERLGLSEGLLGEVDYAALDLKFEEVYRSILDGEATMDAVDVYTGPLLTSGPLKHDGRPPGVALVEVSDTVLADIAENQLPQVGLIGPDRILGPWADEPVPRWLRVQVAAVMAFVPEVEPGVPPWARTVKRRPRPPSAVRQSLRIMARTPPSLWAVQDGALTSLLPLGPQFMPKGPVRNVPDVPAVIGRVVADDQGYYLAASVPLIRTPPPDRILARVRLEWLRLRRRERRLSLEDALRERSEVLYRSCLEWLWLQLSNQTDPAW